MKLYHEVKRVVFSRSAKYSGFVDFDETEDIVYKVLRSFKVNGVCAGRTLSEIVELSGLSEHTVAMVIFCLLNNSTVITQPSSSRIKGLIYFLLEDKL